MRPRRSTQHPLPPGLAAQLLECAARANPAAVETSSHGWWLRHTTTEHWWEGATIAHGQVDWLSSALDVAESFYRAHDAPACFQICDGCTPGLDQALAARAYAWTAPISLEIGQANHVPVPRTRRGLDVEVTSVPTPNWFAVASSDALHDVDHELAQLRKVRQPSTYVTVYERGEPIAIGRAVSEGGWAGIFDMLTDPLRRGRGAARLVLSTIARTVVDRGASWLYLQVERGNDRARRLYRAGGFREASTYHYRVQDGEPMV